MKILTWNCSQRLDHALSANKDFQADVLIIQECERLDTNSIDSYTSHWIGSNNRRGLAVLTRGNSELANEVFNESLIYFIPVSFKNTAILGVWAFNRRAKTKIHEGSGFPIDAIAHYRSWLTSHKKIIVAGDFNNGPRWDRPGSRNNFQTFNNELIKLGLHSSYHHFTGESPGKESKPTHYHQRSIKKQFHIDYIFTDLSELRHIQLGEFKDWSKFSDHMPLFAEYH